MATNFNYTIQKMEADLAGILHGTTMNQITNKFGLYNRAASKFLLECDPNESIRVIPFPSVIHNLVYDYALPPDVKGNSVLDIQPQIDRTSMDIWTQSYIQAFDVAKTTSMQNGFDIAWNSGLKTIRINAPYLPVPILINDCTELTGNGTWVAGGDAVNLTVNNTSFFSTPSSLQFDLDGSTGTGYVENSTMQAIDLEMWLNQAVEFLYTSLPTGADFTSISFRFGSSASDYYEDTETLNQQGVAFENGWNLMAFPWLGSTVVGSPDPSSITYCRVTYNYTIGQYQTAVLLNNITSNLGKVLNLVYYSKYMFSDTTGAYKQNVTSTTDYINLDTDAYAIFFNLVAYLVGQQQQGLDSAYYDGNFFLNAYQEGLAKYKQRYPSQQQKAQSVYYRVVNGNNYYGRIGGAWWNRT